MQTIDDFKRIAEVEFADIVKGTYRIDYKLRIALIDNSFIEVHLSQRIPDKFGFHWECMDESGKFYRYDNFPDKKWQSVSTYPYHFHTGTQDIVEASPFPSNSIEGFRAFMEFVRNKIK
ncbi:MAG: hypothetical protein A2Z47_10195 [Thermodesulfovibrio sp. RBG_19FT_COMBO_42_12]|nr:MAG: hypothetical protein A2Z47_10195 [Thermodesulfovibrio sp. RBG_19FT_COMBO_42_12]